MTTLANLDAELGALSTKELTAHFQRRAPGQHLPKGLAKSAIIARINALPPLAAPEPQPTTESETFSVSGWAKANGKDGREIRKQLRQLGKRAPYSLADLQALDAHKDASK